MENRAVTGAEEVLGGQPGPGRLVHGDDGHICLGVALDSHYGGAGRESGQRVVGRRERGDHGQAFNRLAGEPPDGVSDRLAVDRVDGHHRDKVTMLLGG